MTEYICYACGVKTMLKRHFNRASDVPSTDECPECGEVEEFEYL